MNPSTGDLAAIVAPDLWITLLKGVAMLSLVLGAIIGALYLMRHLVYGRSGQVDRGVIRTLASCYVAPKERILLIEVLGEKLLIGVTPHSINCLATVSGEQGIEIPAQDVPSGFFTTILRGAMDRRSQ